METQTNPGALKNASLTLEIIERQWKAVVIANTVNLVNGIFLVVSTLLLILGQVHEGIFLGSALALNVIIGIAQDMRAKVALEKLQILAAPRITRIKKDGKEEQIMLREVAPGDVLEVSLGDQVPADSQMIESRGMEVNEALITGESNYVKKNPGDDILAGSIVMAGAGMLKVNSLPQDSYVARMTEKIKRYKPNPSPIQKTLNAFIKYMSYLLLVVIAYVVAHGLTVNDLFVSMVKDIGALTGTLVPQGLVLSITVFFAYGAIKLLQEKVLLQEINATEKLGRIKNLCVDKTGTLTERRPILEETIFCGGNGPKYTGQMLAGYIKANRDTSELVAALQPRAAAEFYGGIIGSVPFSSERKYGMATLEFSGDNVRRTAVLGAPDILAGRIRDEKRRGELAKQIAIHTKKAKRLLLLAETGEPAEGPSLDKSEIFPVALFVLSDPLRPGTENIIDFFQKRDIRIRVISGDDPQTVQAVARRAGMKYTDMVVTGGEMENWDEVEYEERVPAFHLFARIRPAQKEKIVARLKGSGFTAMVGDGANDALAIKKADLGIAMFDGANATRQIAQMVLLDNSFAAVPKGVSLAEAVIQNIELVASVFLNKVVAGLTLFLALAILGYTYPLSPSNTTIINYFTVWLPMAYWTVFPVPSRGRSVKAPFLRRVFLFSIVSGLIMAAAAAGVFLLEPDARKSVDSSILVVIAMIALGFWYFVLAPLSYGARPDKKQRRILALLAAACAAVLAAAIWLPAWSAFFELQKPGFTPLAYTLAIVFAAGYIQYWIAVRCFYRK